MSVFKMFLTMIQTITYDIISFLNYIKINEYVIPCLLKFLMLGIITLIIYSLIILTRKSLKNLCNRANLDTHTCQFLQKGAHYFIIIIGTVLALQNLGIEITPIITALGIFSVALSYALKDFISNIIAGLLLISYPHFKINDIVKLKDWQGKVVDINIRYTTLQDGDMIIFVPSFVVYTTTIAIISSQKK